MLEFISHQNDRPDNTSLMDDFLQPHQDKAKEKDESLSVMLKNKDVDTIFAKNHFELIVESIFREFKNSFDKNYTDNTEHVKRKDIFRHNLR